MFGLKLPGTDGLDLTMADGRVTGKPNALYVGRECPTYMGNTHRTELQDSMKLTDQTIISAAGDRQVSTNFDEEVIIMETEKGLYYQLNEVGAVIWRTIQRTPSTIGELVSAVQSDFEVGEEQCRADIEKLVGDLHEAGLVVIDEKP